MELELDFDLSSIQEARNLACKAKQAQNIIADFSEEQIDKILQSMVAAVETHAEGLAKMAVDETNYGVFEHKVTKNLFAAKTVYDYVKTVKTTGIIRENKQAKIVEVAVPVGVVMGITPTTNPTSTIIHNTICAVKGGNAVVFSPHPNALKCSAATAQLLNEAAVKAGAPDGTVGCLTQASPAATQELMHHEAVSVIVATGGSAMVKAAYSAGKPAYGVGPGNVPVFIERSADVGRAVSDIIASKTFDNGMICASEQAILADEPIREDIMAELKKQGGYFMDDGEIQKVSTVVMTPSGSMVPALVGQTAKVIAAKAGFCVPDRTKILIAPLKGYGKGYPLSHEKLTCVLGFYTVKDWREACTLSIELLKLGGIGHSFAIHSQNETIIREFVKKPVFRILVNTPSALGGIGYSTNLIPSLTLGCGTWGGSSISENLGPHHFINIKRIAYGVKEIGPALTQLHKESPLVSANEITAVVQQVLQQLQLAGKGV